MNHDTQGIHNIVTVVVMLCTYCVPVTRDNLSISTFTPLTKVKLSDTFQIKNRAIKCISHQGKIYFQNFAQQKIPALKKLV